MPLIRGRTDSHPLAHSRAHPFPARFVHRPISWGISTARCNLAVAHHNQPSGANPMGTAFVQKENHD